MPGSSTGLGFAVYGLGFKVEGLGFRFTLGRGVELVR